MTKNSKLLIHLISILCFLTLSLSLSQAGEITLTVGSGSGLPGSTDNVVEISLDNLDNRAMGVQCDICRGFSLSLSACENTARTSGIMCSSQPLENGCDRILFFSYGGGFIDTGTGPIITLNYDVLPEALEGTCETLTLEDVLVPSCIDDGNGGCTTGPAFTDVALQSGQFCFGDAVSTTTTTAPGTTTSTVPTTTTAPSTTTTVVTTTTTVTLGPVTFAVGDGSGTPDSTDNLLPLSVENPDNSLYGFQFDLCLDSAASYLTLSACETVGRAIDYDCMTNRVADEYTECNGEADRVIVVSLSGAPIEAGAEDNVVNLYYDVAEKVSPGNCDDLSLKNVKVNSCIDDGSGGYTTGPPFPPENVSTEPGEFCVPCMGDEECDDGLFCNGFEECINELCHAGTYPCPGQSCSEDLGCYTPTTTTTVVPPPPPPPSTTTTTTLSSYRVTISPSSAMVDSGATLQFSAETTSDGEKVEGAYSWQLVPASSIGSDINEDGLFTAGENTTPFEIEETVKVTDTDHGNNSATAQVTVEAIEVPPPECEVKINPSFVTISSGGALSLEANTAGEGCLAGDYEWSIESEIGSVIDLEGNYSAGANLTGSPTTDIITVVDLANFDIRSSATITVENKIAHISPHTLLGSRWIPLPYFLIIVSEDIHFGPHSTISFEPKEDIVKIAQLGLGDLFLSLFFLNAHPQEGAVNVAISADRGVVTGEITIKLLPLSLVAEPDTAEPSMGISLDDSPLLDKNYLRKSPL